jgi:hypothetical protein
MSLQVHRPLIVRSNRTLGTLLLEKKLITSDQLDVANEKLLEHLEKGDLRRANLLHVLMFDLQVLTEDAYLEAVIEKYGLAPMDLHGCQFKKVADLALDFTACWATWTIPFDLVDDFYLIATVLYPAPPAVKYWQDKYAGKNIIWYALTVRSFQSAMEKLEQLKTESTRTAHPTTPKAHSKSSGGTKSPLSLKK